MRNGITPVWASEIEAFPIRVTQKHFPGMIHVGDITKLDGAKLPPVDIICGGSPCQDLSVAGTRSGLAGARSGLFMEQIRIVKEMRAADVHRGRTARFVRPRFLAWENVPGAFSSGSPKGEDFRIVLEEICKISGYPVHVPRPHPWPWQFAGRILLGDSFSLGALEFSLKKAGSSAQARLEQTLGQLYEQTVPAPVREYLDSRAAPAPRPRRPAKPAPKERPARSGEEGGA